jgi:hypothetical protein
MSKSNKPMRWSVRLARSRWIRAGASLALWAGVGVAQYAFAQTPEPAPMTAPDRPAIARFPLNKHLIQLPIQLEEKYRPMLAEIHLYVKESPTAAWTLREKVPATQNSFTFKAPQDGEYWFTMVTVDRQGRQVPADVSKEEPAMVIIVDSQPPQVDLMLLGTVPEGQLIQCDIRDANPDPTRTRVQYQTGDKQFRDLEAAPDRPNIYCIPAQANTTGQIRIYASDIAGNVTSKEFNLTALASVTKSMPPAPALPGASDAKLYGPQLPSAEKVQSNPGPMSVKPSSTPPAVLPQADKLAPRPLGGKIEASPGIGSTPAGNVLQGPPLSEGTSIKPMNPSSGVQQVSGTTPGGTITTIAAKRETTPAHTMLVGSTRLFLDYRVEQTGPSGVGRVEVWATRDKGQNWQKIGEDTTRKSPVDVQLPGEGQFGLTLVVSNGLGFGAQPPAAGDTPQWWVEVDTTKPVAQITSVQLSFEKGAVVQIGWTSQDRNLGAAPAELSYAVSREGPWLPIARGLKAEGQIRWAAPQDLGPQVYLRLTVRDEAGNTTITETTQPVTLDDMSRPRAHIAGISTDGVAPPAPKD